VTTESLVPNDVVVHGSGVAHITHHINSTVLLAVFCQLLSQTKPMREEAPGDTADV